MNREKVIDFILFELVLFSIFILIGYITSSYVNSYTTYNTDNMSCSYPTVSKSYKYDDYEPGMSYKRRLRGLY